VSDDLERLVGDLLAPLNDIAPAQRSRGRAVIRRHHLLAVVVAALVVVLAAGATWATLQFTASPTPTPVSPGQPLACLGLVGGTAGDAQTILSDHGYAIEWHLATFNPPDGSTFTVVAQASVPADAIVRQVLGSSPDTVIVVVSLPSDTYAPPVTPEPCRP
jgi:hypothetical protein